MRVRLSKNFLRPTYKALVTILHQQCDVTDGKVAVKAKTGGDCLQNPSDPDATYDGHKGPGYQVQITETCSPDNAVQLITGALPRTAAESDAAAVVPMLDQLEAAGLLPEEMLADTIYGSDENVQEAQERGVELVAPIPGRPPANDPQALTLDDFAVDERTGDVTACPAGHTPLTVGATPRRKRRGSRCRRPPARAVHFATPARSTVRATTVTSWSSAIRISAWPGGGGNKRPPCLMSGMHGARGSS